jgi:hypothetical protein
MKTYTINNGAFTSTGNFSGYTAKGVRVHFHKRQMESLGWSVDEDVTFPFFSIGDEKEITTRDKDGELTDITVMRLTALSAFKTKAEIVQAYADDALLDVEIQQAVKTQATSAGLSETQVNALALASF